MIFRSQVDKIFMSAGRENSSASADNLFMFDRNTILIEVVTSMVEKYWTKWSQEVGVRSAAHTAQK